MPAARSGVEIVMVRIKKNGPMRYVFRIPVYLYRCGLGRLLGYRFLLLVHVGRRTGLRRQTVLEVLEYRKERNEAVVMSGFGARSDWLLNIEATPRPEVTIGGRHFIASYRFLAEDEAVQVLHNYEYRNRWIAPIVRVVLSGLLGWKFQCGSPPAGRSAAACRIPADSG